MPALPTFMLKVSRVATGVGKFASEFSDPVDRQEPVATPRLRCPLGGHQVAVLMAASTTV